MTDTARGSGVVDTYGTVLDLIRSHGTVSRTELVGRSGLTSPSITRIVRQMLEDGLVTEVGTGDFTGGKRRTLLQLNASARRAVGVLIDEVDVTVVLTDLHGQVLARRVARGAGNRIPERVVPKVVAEVESLVQGEGLDRQAILGVGVATNGLQDTREHGLRADLHATEWQHFPLARVLGEALGCPVVTENDATSAAIGEYWTQRLPTAHTFAVVYMTSGFGLGLVNRGEVYRGASSNVGEIGHVTVDPAGPECVCGRRGCLHAVGGNVAVVRQAYDLGLETELGLKGTPRSAPKDFHKISKAAADGHPEAEGVIQRAADALASVLVSISNVLDLDQIVFAGPGFGPSVQRYADTAAERLRSYAYVRAVHTTLVTISTLGVDAAALGAASLVLHERLTTNRPGSR